MFIFAIVNIHEKYIKRCIEIAKNGLGKTAPNPMVGCVIVYNEKIIGEGFTSPFGGPHAEVNAINSVEDKALLAHSTLYVTLEPCSHFGKTPPCADAIIRHNIPRVVVGAVDTHKAVAGSGISRLKASGCEVIVGILKDEVEDHHKRFFTFHNKKRPYIILKWATSADGFLSPKFKNSKQPVWITNSLSRQLVHKWRAEEQAILVGTKTVLDDNPSLTVRDWSGNNPTRIVLDQILKLSSEYSVFNNEARTITLAHLDNPSNNQIRINWQDKTNIARQICDVLYEQNITSVIIEGGRQTLQTFINENLWDEARIFTGQVAFSEGTPAPSFEGRLISEERIKSDSLKIYYND